MTSKSVKIPILGYLKATPDPLSLDFRQICFDRFQQFKFYEDHEKETKDYK
ncbi:MAG: hypothetical protein AABY49_13255 [Planctomycetota bacterium]